LKRHISLRAQAGVLILAVIGVIAGVFYVLRTSGQEIERMTSSVSAIQDLDNVNQALFNGMVNQETGVRGYALTGNRVFLEPYHAGLGGVADAERKLKISLPGGDAALVAAEEQAASAWQTWAVGRIEIVDQKGSGGAAGDADGKRAFDAFRLRWSAVDQHDSRLEAAARASLTNQLSTQMTIRGVGLLIILAVLGALSTIIFLSILRPMTQQARAVARLGGETAIDIPGRGRRDEVGRLASALETLQRTLRERLGLAQAMGEVGGRAELSEVVEVSTRRLAQELDADEVVITVPDSSSRRVLGSYAGFMEVGESIGEVTPGDEALAERRTILTSIDKLAPGLIKDRADAAGYGPVLTLPMLSGGESVGVVSCLRRIGRPAFSAADAERAEILVPFVGAATKAALLIGQLREANQVKSRFLANMSHELRTPLNAILGFSQVLSGEDFGPLNDRQQRYVGHIENSGRRLLDLINDVLDLAKVEAGHMEVRPERLELAPVLLESRSEIERLAAAKGVDLTYVVAPGVWASADRRRLQQVVLNLLSNAVKFTPAGGRVTLAAAAVGEGAEITVTDTGMGIAPEEQERIFDEFVQADNDESREQKGTGLGLSLSRKLAELMGGKLTVSSELGGGSRFTIELALDETAPSSADGPLILVVEDEAPGTELLTVILNEANYRAVSAGNAADAAVAVRRERPDAILLDIMLPGPNGWTLLDELKADNATVDIPVIALTMLDAPLTAHRQQLAGFFTKPVSRTALVRLLNVLTGKPSPREEGVALG
jgi:signal transduction histidine kinase/CHASE3 domain sensor protein